MADLPDLSRYDDWLAWLTERAASDADARCAWVGGSAATGGYDDWSDLDVDVLCTPGTSTAVYTPLAGRGAGRASTCATSGRSPSTCGRTAGSAS